jgi:hypothetical protein
MARAAVSEDLQVDTRELSCICDGCVSRVQATNQPARLWGCDVCHRLACRHMLAISDDGGRICTRCAP